MHKRARLGPCEPKPGPTGVPKFWEGGHSGGPRTLLTCKLCSSVCGLLCLCGCMLNYCITSWLKTYSYPTILNNCLLFLCLYDFGSRLMVSPSPKFRSYCLGYSKPVPRNVHDYLYKTVFLINRLLERLIFIDLPLLKKRFKKPQLTKSYKF